ncbi:MAG: tetratricopeptide repeat protein [Patescibacteria group bacterium]|nr:tetratricopeptide repeat protein [Patescibacteria group bacterium]
MLNQQTVDITTSSGRGAETLPKVSKALGWIIEICLKAIVILTPLFFLPITLDVLELNKQTLFIVLILVATTAWFGKALADRKFVMARSWFNIVIGLFLVGWFVTAAFSKDIYLSMFGNFGQMQMSFVTIAGLVIFYFLIINHLTSTKKLYSYLVGFLVSGLIAGAFGLLQLFGIFSLGWLADFSKVNTFNTIGTINALAVYMVIPLVLSASLTVFGCKDGECKLDKATKGSMAINLVVWLSMVVSLLVLIIVDFWVAWAAALFGLVLLVVLPLIRSSKINHPIRIAVPVVLACIAIALLVFKTPIKLNLPAEVAPSMTASWNIAKSTLNENPLFGTGPGTWIYDYAKFRSPAVNLSQFWTIRFERGLSTALTLLPTIGIVGIALLLMIIISALVKSATHLIKEKDDNKWQLYLTIFVSWATIVFIAFLYNYNFAHVIAFGFFLSLLVALIANKAYVWEARKGSVSSVVISIVFAVLCVSALSGTWVIGQRLAADAAYSDAVMSYRGGESIDSAIDSLNSAVAMNRWNDIYYRNLSQAYLIKAGQEFETLSKDQDGAGKINQIIAAAIDTGKKATEINPMNIDNWENLAIIYQSIASFTQGADEFAIDNFVSALEREPNNPVYSNEIGKIHILRADAMQTLLQSEDEQTKLDAEQKIKDELDKAAEWFNRSIQAKPDFAPAHYFLGLVYERQGRIPEAITKLEQVLSVNDKDVGVAFQLAILYYRNNEKDKSRTMFEQIVAFAPEYANARWYLSALYEEQGENAKALEQVKIVAETNKDNQNVNDRISYLEGLISKNSAPAANPEPLPEPVADEIVTNPEVDTNPFELPAE